VTFKYERNVVRKFSLEMRSRCIVSVLLTEPIKLSVGWNNTEFYKILQSSPKENKIVVTLILLPSLLGQVSELYREAWWVKSTLVHHRPRGFSESAASSTSAEPSCRSHLLLSDSVRDHCLADEFVSWHIIQGFSFHKFLFGCIIASWWGWRWWMFEVRQL